MRNNESTYMRSKCRVGLLRYEYHATALIGYQFTSSTTCIRVMDPAYECYKYCTLGTNGKWTYAFGSETFTWIQMIRLLYS